MRVLFVNRLAGPECLGRMPLGILYLSAALKQRGHEVRIADACREQDVLKALDAFQPRAAFYSVRTGYHRFYTRLNRKIKTARPKLLSVFGGPHATFFPEMIERDPTVDAVCIGEGEEAACDLLDRLGQGAEYEKTPNFWVRRGGEVYRNPVRPLVKTMDELPFPDRDLLAPYPSVRNFPIRAFIASRGCPYDCTYCFNHAYFRIYAPGEPRVRLPSVDRLIEEMRREAARAPFASVHFEDDIFGLPPRWLEEFSERYPTAVGRPFTCSLRVELVTDKSAELLGRSGCSGAWIGLESGDETVRLELLDRSNGDDTTRVGVGRLKRNGIAVCTENIIGIPTTTLEHDLKTLRFNLALKPAYANCSIFQPYPRTDLGRVATEAGLFSGDFDELGDFYEDTSLRVPHKKELANLQELFAWVNEVPALSRWVPLLVRLPLHPVYRLLNLALKVWAIARRLNRVPMRLRYLVFLPQLLGIPQKARASVSPSPAVPPDSRAPAPV